MKPARFQSHRSAKPNGAACLAPRVSLALVVAFLLASGPRLWAKDLYLRAGATGANNGADWNNAWNRLSAIQWGSGPGLLGPGDTLWMAGGVYTDQLMPGTNGTATNWITLKRVQSSDSTPTNAVGWNAAFDSQVVISPAGQNAMVIYHAGSYLTLDGRVDSGIRLVGPNTPTHYDCLQIATSVSYLTLTNIDFYGSWGGVNSGLPNMQGDTRCIDGTAWDGSFYEPIYNLTVTHCRLHGMGNLMWLYNLANGVIEYCQMYDNEADNNFHANICATVGCRNMTFRYNNIYNWQVEGILMLGPNDQPGAFWYIYGNVWHDGLPDPQTPRVLTCQDTIQGPVYFYNNTVANVFEGVATEQGGSWALGSQGRNNIYYNVGGPNGEQPVESLPDDDYDFSDRPIGTFFGHGPHDIGSGSNPFINDGSDYHLFNAVGNTFPRNNGVSLPAPFAYDLEGHLRSAGGGWDIGAYAYTGPAAQVNPLIAVSPNSLSFGALARGTTNFLTFSVRNAGGGTLAGTVTVPPPFTVVPGAFSLGSNQVQTIAIGYTPSGASNDNQMVLFSGGGGATAPVSGSLQP